MKWLVMKHRIMHVDSIGDYSILKPLPDLPDPSKVDGYTVMAQHERYPQALYRGTNERCEAFMAALGECLNIEMEAVKIETIISVMAPEPKKEEQ